jgi:hypothetical protein
VERRASRPSSCHVAGRLVRLSITHTYRTTNYFTTSLVNGNTYACNVTIIPTKAARAML